jgi:multidrug efflux pump subunit AcrA (membrane-fusion protein)
MVTSHHSDDAGPLEPGGQGGRRPTANTTSRWRVIRIGLVIGVGVAGLLALGVLPRLRASAELNEQQQGAANPVFPVSVVLPQPAPASSDLVLPGNIQAIQETTIYARATGYVRQRFVDIGSRVQAGQVLAELETPELDKELAQAQANLGQARATQEQARATLAQAQAGHAQAVAALEREKAALDLALVSADRWTRLVQQQAVARQEADERVATLNTSRASTDAAQANVTAAQSTIDAAQANVGVAAASVRANEANVERLTSLQSFKQIRAPFAGIITARGIDRGALISAGTGVNGTNGNGANGGGSGAGDGSLFRIAQIDRLRIYVNAPQSFVRSIAPGLNAQVLLQEFPGQAFAGRVTSTANALDPASRTLLTEVQVPNERGVLFPGMYAQVKFAIVPAEPRLLIPASALIIRGQGPQVATVRNDTVHYLSVDVGRDLGATVEVVSGLKGDEWLIVNPGDGLADGARVRAGGV